MKHTALRLLSSFFVVSLSAQAASPPPQIDPKAIDPKISPCEDFYQYACGRWEKKAKIPDDRPAWSRGFMTLAENNLAKSRALLEKLAKNPASSDDKDARRLGDYYATCMNEKKAESDSMKTLQVELKEIDALPDVKALPARLAALHLRGVNAFFNFGSFQDFRDSSSMIAAVDQGGLSMPDRDYYLSDKGKMPEIRKKFRAHIERLLKLTGVKAKDARQQAQTIVQLETELAKVSMSRVDRRDPNKVYHRLERKGLKELAPQFGWDEYFQASSTPEVQGLNVIAPDFFKGFGTLLAKMPIQDLRTYLRWQLVRRANEALGKKFVNETFRFTSAAFGGEKKIKARWKRCVSATEAAMGEALGRLWVKTEFPESAKAQAREIITQVEAAFEKNLDGISWMDDDTKEAALEKAKRVVNQVGYPDKWRDFDKMQITRESYLKNLFAASIFNNLWDLGKIGKPVDRTEWVMYPQTVNAYYSPENNKMVFPAGILQSPFFDPKGPQGANYGGIGMVMGHEFTHGFDDEGRQFDEKGNLRDWWSPKVGTAFTEKAECLVKQYDAYVPIDKLHVNGKLTLGENIADQGGLKLAYDAYQKAAGDKANPKDFFLGFAQSWCTKRRPELTRTLLTVDPHSPPKYRVNGPLSNFPKFAEAYACKPGTKMAPVKACTVW